jgi:hypothetical protein
VQISIEGGKFLFDGELTYSGFPGAEPEALGRLMNTRMVQATFEDENPETVGMFSYPDGSPYDPDRQTDEFIAALPEYRRHGVIAATLNFQGGYPRPAEIMYSSFDSSPDQFHFQRWHNSAYTSDGTLKWRYANRMERIARAADEEGMVMIVGLFYFGQDYRLQDEMAVKRAVEEAIEFLVGLDTGNVMIEVNNECDVGYVRHGILQSHRVHELIELAREVCRGRFLISTSYGGGSIPGDNVLETADFILVHGNLQGPDGIRRMVATLRAKSSKPVVFNEDSTSIANLRAAWESGASWGYYDAGVNNYHDGFQSPPTNWTINTPEKTAFFTTVAELVGIEL